MLRSLFQRVFGRGEVAAKAATPEPPAEDAMRKVSESLARVLRPQAAYRWMLPSLAAITPQYVEMVLRGALAGSHVQQWELFDLMFDTWPELAACAQELRDGVMSLRTMFEPFAEEDEDPTPAAIERCKLVSGALRRMMPDATADENDFDGMVEDIIDGWFRGVGVQEIAWQTYKSPMGGMTTGPRATFWVHPVCFAWSNEGRLGLRTDVDGNASASNLGGASFQPQPAAAGSFPPNKFLIGIHKAKSGTALGGSLLRALAFWWSASNFAADWLLNLAQIFGLPFRLATYEPNAAKETIDEICRMLQNMGSAGYGAFPSGTQVELIEAKTSGDHSPQGELLDRADRYARMLILGQTMSGSQDASKGGGKAFGSVESDVKQKRIQACAKYVARVLNTQLVPSILMLNYGDTSDAPQVVMLQDEEGDYQEAQRDTLLAGSGLEIPVSFLRKKYGLPNPTAGEETIGGEPDEDPGDDDFDSEDEDEEIASGQFYGNQHTGSLGRGKPPETLKMEEADRELTKGVTVADKDGDNVRFGMRLKNKLESKPEYVSRKVLLKWGKETVKTGKKVTEEVKGERRAYYGKVFTSAGEEKGLMVIVSVKDGEAFNLFRAPRRYLRSKGLSAKERDEPGEQPPVALLCAIAAAGRAQALNDDTTERELVKRLAEIANVQDDALFASQFRELISTL